MAASHLLRTGGKGMKQECLIWRCRGQQVCSAWWMAVQTATTPRGEDVCKLVQQKCEEGARKVEGMGVGTNNETCLEG